MCDFFLFFYSLSLPSKSATLLTLRVQGGYGHGGEGERGISNISKSFLPFSLTLSERKIIVALPNARSLGQRPLEGHTVKSVQQSAGLVNGLPESIPLFVSLAELLFPFLSYSQGPCAGQVPHALD